MFIGGLDFFPDGRAAVCTFHGDVFIVSGLDAALQQVTWRRFATGLYHPLGLKIVNGEIYVSGRDGITRLRDLDGDGEADSYEVFNWDVKVTKSFHEFVFDLQTDPAGNFYFAKAGPVKNGGRGFDRITEHHGCLFRVPPDGSKLEVIATGFRAPNGIGVGPIGEITSGDNEGTWTPGMPPELGRSRRLLRRGGSGASAASRPPSTIARSAGCRSGWTILPAARSGRIRAAGARGAAGCCISRTGSARSSACCRRACRCRKRRTVARM